MIFTATELVRTSHCAVAAYSVKCTNWGFLGLITHSVFDAPDKIKTHQNLTFCNSSNFPGVNVAGGASPKCMVEISFPSGLDFARYCTSENAKHQGTDYRVCPLVAKLL